MSKVSITVQINTSDLCRLSDEHIAMLWSVAQANPAKDYDREAGEIVSTIGFEIIHRWLRQNPPPLYNHQARDHYWSILKDHGKWVDGVWTPNYQGQQEASA